MLGAVQNLGVAVVPPAATSSVTLISRFGQFLLLYSGVYLLALLLVSSSQCWNECFIVPRNTSPRGTVPRKQLEDLKVGDKVRCDKFYGCGF